MQAGMRCGRQRARFDSWSNSFRGTLWFVSAHGSQPPWGGIDLEQPWTILLVKLFDRCGMDGTYSEASIAWKLVRCIQQRCRMVYRSGSKLVSGAFRLAFWLCWNSLFLAQKTNYSCEITCPFSGAMWQSQAEDFLQTTILFGIQARDWHLS